MARTLPVCALLILVPCGARADDAPARTIVRLTVSPRAAAEAGPAYQLLPELREMNPGNPIQGYLLCFMEQNHFFFDKTAGGKPREVADDAAQKPARPRTARVRRSCARRTTPPAWKRPTGKSF